MTTIAIVYHSGYGHTAVQAKAVAAGAARVTGTDVKLISVEEIEQHWDVLNAADGIIFGSPTYMGSVSAPFKGFMDASSKVWFVQGWKDKIAGGFTNSASYSGDKLNTLIQLAVFASQHGMIWVGPAVPGPQKASVATQEDLNRVGSYLGAMAQSDADLGADLAPPRGDQDTAAALGERIARLAEKLAHG